MIAAWDNRVLMAFPRTVSSPGVWTHRVLQITTGAHALSGTWQYDSKGRLVALPSLPDGRIAGFVGTRDGAAALLITDATRLLVLNGNAWQEAELPEGWSARDVRVPLLVALPAGIGLLDLAGPESGLWRGTLGDQSGRREGVVAPQWVFERLAFSEAPNPDGPVVMAGGHATFAARDGSSLWIWQVGPNAAYRLASVGEVGPTFAFVGLADANRVAIVWPEITCVKKPQTVKDQPETVRYRIVEISAATGRELYRGPVTGREPVSATEFRLLALLLVAVMIMIVLFVLRPEGARAALSLPEGLAMAESGRRVLGSLIDLLAAVIVASKLVGMTVGQALLVFGLVGDQTGEAMSLLLATIAVGLTHCTTCEWLFGRSLGKALVGCRVFHVRLSRGSDGTVSPVVVRPSLWRALARNIVKWVLPPVAMAGLNLPDRRHRGDVVAGTAVVVPAGGPEGD
jgi:hypothetical protein